MKTNIKLYYSKDKADPKKIFSLLVAIKRAGTRVGVMTWTAAPEEEKQVVSFLLLNFVDQLVKQQKTIKDLGTPILTWNDPDGTSNIRIGYEEILAEL